mmetsp:Transcript_96919/g.312935  ORF Transcript_96919/g.312935 Transcript_96919/m.312935 type:complete len:257 (+) Transcript_96919:80-850(+)
MLSLVRGSPWDGGAGCEASRCLVAPGAETSDAEEEGYSRGKRVPSHVQVPPGGPQPRSWLLRLGAPTKGAGYSSARSRISRTERARHAILAWRLERPYLLYCLACFIVTSFLLCWNLAKGMQNHWNLPQWQHHRWEEATEVGIGVLIVAETLLTMRVLGLRAFFCSAWCIFDFVVALLTIVSICYGLEHLGLNGEICEANVPLLMLRFVLQPARVLATVAVTYRARRMQSRVDELRVDFDSLQNGGTSFTPMQELR